MNTHSHFRPRGAAAAIAAFLACIHTGCLAQTQQVEPADPYQAYPPGYAQQPPAQFVQPSRPGSMRQLFAGTVAAVVEGLGAGLTAGLAHRVNGAILNWFGKPNANAATTDAQNAQVPSDPYAVQAQSPSPSPATPDVYAKSAAQEVYAGIAYELHTIGPSGVSTPVDAGIYTFSTGERFIVHYRPTLPGRVTVHNVNPIGQETQIDSVDVAAGQLVTLGPYEFRGYKGDEILQLQLAPCRTDALILATRDIVKASDPATGDGLYLTECGAMATRGAELRTRDIVKVGVEGDTSFAFDPATPQEVASGQFAPRELTIALRHR